MSILYLDDFFTAGLDRNCVAIFTWYLAAIFVTISSMNRQSALLDKQKDVVEARWEQNTPLEGSDCHLLFGEALIGSRSWRQKPQHSSGKL